MDGIHEKQGHLSNLNEKPTPELKDLLNRQEKLYANQRFISHLPDKGEKINTMIKRLKTILAQREQVDDTAELFQKMALNAEHARQHDHMSQDEDSDEEMDPLKQIINKGMDEKTVRDQRPAKSGQEKVVNSYEKIIKKSHEKPDERKPKKYFPFRSLRAKEVNEIPTQRLASLDTESRKVKSATSISERDIVLMEYPPNISDMPSTSDSNITNDSMSNQSMDSEHSETKRDIAPDISNRKDASDSKHSENMDTGENITHTDPNKATSQKSPPDVRTDRTLKHRYDESLESAATWREPEHESTKMISIEESLGLLKEQKRKQEELQARQAAQRLAQQLGVKMATFDPEGSGKLVYRNPGTISDEDDIDSDDAELEYPD